MLHRNRVSSKGQGTKDVVAANEVAEKQVHVLTKKLEGVNATHAQGLVVSSKEVDGLKQQLVSARKSSDDAEYEKNGAKAR